MVLDTVLALAALAVMFSGDILPAAAKGSLKIAEKLGLGFLASEFYLKAAVCLNPRDAKHNFYIGLWYHKAHQLKKAEEFYKKAIELDPKIANARYQLALVYFISGRFAKALQEINKELEINPLNKRSYYIRGLIQGYSGKLTEAEADFKTFLDTPLAKEINGWGGYNDLAWILMKEKKYREALRVLKEAEEIFPSNTWIYNGLGGAYLALKNYNLAEKYYQKAYEGAKKMTVEEWLLAYPAHDSKTAEDGIKQIISTLLKNLDLTRKR